ncbi:DUF6285 domain-containing protein [Aeromicrobium sp. CF4.19]|uniref:DUF6285 domain-containing protein n=1 Tax=Aeromicrobium sp. CF4.19 TaxID=3373082 RepID=UPI003EE4D7B3
MARGVPTTIELVQALRRFLEDEVRSSADDRLSYMGRVAANVAGTVERELTAGPALAARHRERLAGFGVADESELANAIRRGVLEGRRAEVVDVLLADVAGKLGSWNPDYLEPSDRRHLTGLVDGAAAEPGESL